MSIWRSCKSQQQWVLENSFMNCLLALWSFLLYHFWFVSSKLNSVITAQCNCITRINTYLHAWPPVCSVELKMFWKGPSILTPISNALMQVYFMWTSYHMATLTMQHNIRTREMKDETLSCPLKHKPFGFNKSLEPLILSAFCCFRENVMCWFHFVSPWYHSCSPSFHPFSAGN